MGEASAEGLLVVGRRTGAAGRPFGSGPQLSYVDLQIGNCSTEGVAMHAELASRTALVALIFLEHGHDEPLLKLAHRLGV